MEQFTEIAKQAMQFLSQYHLWEAIFIVVVILITLAVKIPIKRAAVKFEEKHGIDKSYITWIVGFIPFILAFALVFAKMFYDVKWDIALLGWKEVGAEAAIVGGGAVGFYEFIKKLKKAFVAAATKSKQDKAEKAAKAGAIVEVSIHGDPKEIEKPVEQPVEAAPSEEAKPEEVQPVKKISLH